MPRRIRLNASLIIAFQKGAHCLLKNGCVVVEDNVIVHVGRDFEGECEETIALDGFVITPGLINTHSHLTGSPLDKSFIEDVGGRQFYMSGLPEMLPARAAATDAEMEAAAIEYSMIELIRTGTTTFMEIGFRGQDVAAEAERYGLRAYIGEAYSSGRWFTQDGHRMSYTWKEDGGLPGFQAATEFIEKMQGRANGRISGFLSPLQVALTTPELLKASRAASERLRVPLALHVAEAVFEFDEMVQRHGMTPIEYLDHVDFLNDWCILGHVIFTAGNSWVQFPGDDLKRLADSGASVAHCPWVFARRGIAMESFASYQRAGVNLCLGTDTAPQSMIEAMRWAAVIGKIKGRSSTSPTALDIFNAATINAAKMLHRDDLGRLAPGAKADLLCWDGASIFMSPVRDPLRNIVYSAQAEDLKHSMIDGHWAMWERVVCAGDERSATRKLQTAAERMWKAVGPGDWAGRTTEQLSPMSIPMFD